MYAFTTLLAFTLALFAPAANAIDYHGYSSTVSCSGDSFGCSDGGAVCCGPFPTGFGFSAQFDNLPAGSQGQGYSGSNGCSTFLFQVFGPGTKCWNGGGAKAEFLNWFHSAGRRSAKFVERSEEESSSANCTAPNFFRYTTAEGAVRAIKVPANAAETIASLSAAQDYESLASYETYSA